ncbi:hypothetical protein TeGR_g10299 [Tetraparma gracilis]|uniref:AB hydrolase-1 domain-containing protein n=1 Tax=Tetraparma gracilis TaxID=2962635 RepID=A0ABQ6MYP1_9STRA|nr:hypothetical protein TeGR_g10299 [Tetraparma gracilis]
MMLIILPFVKSASVLLAFLYFAGAENSHKLRKTNPQCETPLVFETLTHPPLNKEPKIRFSITPPEGTGHIDSPMILAGEHVVVYFAGLFGSRLEHFESPDDRNRPFLITLDRPGSGCTNPWKELGPGNTQYTQVADVVLELLDDVNATSFEAVGWSSGGPYALALAHQFEARAETSLSLTRATVVAGDPQWARSSLSTYLHAPHHVLMMFAARCLPRWALSLAIHVGLHILWGAGQVEILSSEEMKKMIANFAEGARFKGDSFDAFADDIVLERANDWGFELEDIKSPVRVLHSPGDKIVPFAAGVENADRLPNGVLVDMGGEWSLYSEGHLIMEEYWGQIMDWAVSLEELGGPVKKVEKEEENVNTHDEF